LFPFQSWRESALLQNIRVVLVNTSHPGNIGGAARAMKNMGIADLVLVDPLEFPSPKADARASGATDVLGAACVVATLEEALVGCSLVLGTSARDRRIPWPLLDPRESATTSLEQAAKGAKVALVFGREYAGLTNEELQRCHYHVHIPSDPEFGSLNLAAAVQVLTYEVRMAWLAQQGQPTKMEKVEALAEGDFPQAQRLLGRHYVIDGRVLHGQKLARQLGWPTANVQLKRARAPFSGVYLVSAYVDGRKWPGVANIGTRPSVDGDGRAHLEVHLLNFTGDLYGKRMRVAFHHKLRNERKFASLDELKSAIAADVAAAQVYWLGAPLQ